MDWDQKISAVFRALLLTTLIGGGGKLSLIPCFGEILITMVETGEGIELVAEGKANVQGLFFGRDAIVANSDFAFHSGSGMVRVGNPSSVRARMYGGIEGPDEFGSNQEGRQVIGSGDVVGVLPRRGLLVLPPRYESGTPVFGQATYTDVTLADLGLVTGIYEWRWGTHPRTDSLIVRVDSDLADLSEERVPNLLQNGSFEQGRQTWLTSHPMVMRRGDARHGEQSLQLTGQRFAEQIVSLFPGEYRLDFSFAPNWFSTEKIRVVLAEQGVARKYLVDTTYRATGNGDELFWRKRSFNFQVPERIGKHFGQLSLSFYPVEPDDDSNVSDAGQSDRGDVFVDGVRIYRLDEPGSRLLTLQARHTPKPTILIRVGRPGRVTLESSNDFVEWTQLQAPVRVLTEVAEVRIPVSADGTIRYYRALFDSDVERPSNHDRSIAPKVVWINPGTFIMGSGESDPDRDGDEGPQMTVRVTEPFAMGVHEVTQDEYVAVMRVNPSRFQFDRRHPVTNVRWEQAMEYCRRLTEWEASIGRLPKGYEYRLPTEAEWDYACQAGRATRYHFGDDPDYSELAQFAWYEGNSEGVSHPVMTRLPNGFGLFDMHGNVHEWCLDIYGPYPGGELTDPRGPEGDASSLHVIRGGSWLDVAKNLRRSDRHRDWFVTYVGDLGFRVALARRGFQVPSSKFQVPSAECQWGGEVDMMNEIFPVPAKGCLQIVQMPDEKMAFHYRRLDRSEEPYHFFCPYRSSLALEWLWLEAVTLFR